MPHIYSETRKIAACSESEKEIFYRLLCRGFLGVTRQDFIRDFEEKDAVIVLRKEDSEGEVVGWSTLIVLTLELPAGAKEVQEVKAVFSGDTVVLPEYRSGVGLGVELVGYFLQTYDRFPWHSVYYVLTSKGWRTYKIMPFFFNEFAPHYDRPTTADEQLVMDAFGRKKYPRNYDAKRGVITFSPQRVRPDGVDAAPAHPDRHAAFFLSRNPSYLEGHELVCVARIAPANFTGVVRRLVNIDKYDQMQREGRV
jgi:hypothetical protein